uniref:Cathepsin L-like cysteine peptidase 6 protein n=3 Tax=Arachnida TaxID=6854 RepID=U6JMH6_TITSE|nr:cathepsin L-like cysteine peptidase 6 protein [Tityus serrulatus]
MLREAVFAILVALAVASPFNKELDRHWEIFKQVHHKQYQIYEEGFRRLIFEQNVERINKHNLEYQLGRKSYRLGLNAYADLTPQEFVKQMNGFITRANRTSKAGRVFHRVQGVKLPDKVDWRDQGIVTPIKDQAQCGSCWAFSATGSLEGQWAKAHGGKSGLISLSEQNLVDCSGAQGNLGCSGGLMDSAFDYIKANSGIDTESCYPYTALDGSCHFKKTCIGATLTGYVDIPSGDEDALKQAVATVGPVSVAIDASNFSFQLYDGGIYDEPYCSSSLLDHGVLAIGYGTEDGQDYWLVKNSWGTSWGEDGYIQMSRNKDNQCGIATQSSYPTV